MHPQPSPYPEPGNRSPAFRPVTGIPISRPPAGQNAQPRRQASACRERNIRRTSQTNHPPIEPSGTLVRKLLYGRENPYAMENSSTLLENSKRAVRYWWLLLIIGIALLIFSNTPLIERSFWNILLNPFSIPRNSLPVIWESIIIKSRIFLLVASTIWMLIGLLNLQKREKFV